MYLGVLYLGFIPWELLLSVRVRCRVRRRFEYRTGKSFDALNRFGISVIAFGLMLLLLFLVFRFIFIFDCYSVLFFVCLSVFASLFFL